MCKHCSRLIPAQPNSALLGPGRPTAGRERHDNERNGLTRHLDPPYLDRDVMTALIQRFGLSSA